MGVSLLLLNVPPLKLLEWEIFYKYPVLIVYFYPLWGLVNATLIYKYPTIQY